jgi:hypothetical protein
VTNIAEGVNQNLPPALPAKARGLHIREISGVVIQINLALIARGVVKSVQGMAIIGVKQYLHRRVRLWELKFKK